MQNKSISMLSEELRKKLLRYCRFFLEKQDFPHSVQEEETRTFEEILAEICKDRPVPKVNMTESEETAADSESFKNIMDRYLALMEESLNDPDSPYCAEDIILDKILWFAKRLFRYCSLKKEKKEFTRLVDFHFEDEDIYIDEEGDLFLMRPARDGDRLNNRLIRNWISKHPTKQWHICPDSGELVDLAYMRALGMLCWQALWFSNELKKEFKKKTPSPNNR